MTHLVVMLMWSLELRLEGADMNNILRQQQVTITLPRSRSLTNRVPCMPRLACKAQIVAGGAQHAQIPPPDVTASLGKPPAAARPRACFKALVVRGFAPKHNQKPHEGKGALHCTLAALLSASAPDVPLEQVSRRTHAAAGTSEELGDFCC